ncbi:MAG: class I SAM-dependent methyltransferase [SAR202 cluster bacterium]|jgi:SAM-dependent methyltransferase|nr:class I SAM-dependent methyltransferase [SAR202 cluster bacterium]MDP6665705.1 class I SAM-dependent methyltransferase [SAR202 cluster bacterium]MDP6798370.1 class I SAM-dependent methyltransferase [SAR202 cluster bacterium]|tara:strand:+ start:3304 stop:4134 length:831 start_codon:yes stop_codon:yes gene_type:complete
MTEEPSANEFQHLNEEVRDIWDANADFWDQRMGEGNDFHRDLIMPNQLALLDIQPGDNVLDVGCGNGQFARQMADRGARVVGVDIAERMIENAVSRSQDYGDRVRFAVADATDENAMLKVGEGAYDAICCTMAIMDMASIEPLSSAVRRLLKPGGRFVFSVMHPVFNSPKDLVRTVDRTETEDGLIIDTYSVKISKYIQSVAYKGLAMLGQPEPQHYFHRPISGLLNVFFRDGFTLDGIEEPVFGSDTAPNGTLDWDNFNQIPPVLVVRLRPGTAR